ncbi:MAG TPA: dihydrofolate reductase family protein [Ktedonobacterales bacterium]|jgi:dihydrofolate reductase
MRQLILSQMVSLDGYFAGPHDEIDWHVVDDDFNAEAKAFLDSLDLLVFGRVTYELMANYWPTPAGLADDPIIAAKMNSLAKVVFSRTITHLDWQNARLASADLADEITTLKQQPGKNMAIFGSGTITSALTALGLIDIYRMYVAPVILGSGKPMVTNIPHRVPLKLTSSKSLGSGVVVLTYQPADSAV